MNSDVYIYPTDTVWGLGCGIYSKKGRERIIQAKKIEKQRPFSILFDSFSLFNEYFSLPSFMSQSWMEEFFTMESSLALSIQLAKKDIPPPIYMDSPFIVVRCLPFSGIKEIIRQTKSPIITTSLNFSGDDTSILKRDEAWNFHKEHMPDFYFVEDTVTPSGLSSSIVVFDGKKFSFLREGVMIEKIKLHCKKVC